MVSIASPILPDSTSFWISAGHSTEPESPQCQHNTASNINATNRGELQQFTSGELDFEETNSELGYISISFTCIIKVLWPPVIVLLFKTVRAECHGGL